MTSFSHLRKEFHTTILDEGLLSRNEQGIPSNADKDSKPSTRIANGILDRLGKTETAEKLPGQGSGARFERICGRFVDSAFRLLYHMRPGSWSIGSDVNLGNLGIASLDQYEHLDSLSQLSKENPTLAAALGSDYLIKPDVVIIRHPENDEWINANDMLVNDAIATLSSLRKNNNEKPILHASISCKWTIRSDRVQNARSEGLNLVKNRKGRLPHIVVVTGEPMPNRLAAIALGTGEIDCVYHFALKELCETIDELGMEDSREMIDTMIEGKRLRDITDLPLDLVI